MLSIRENHILKKFIEVYEMNFKNGITNLENKNCFEFNEVHFPNKLATMFLRKLDKNEISHLLYLSIVSATIRKNTDFAYLNSLRICSTHNINDLPMNIIRGTIFHAIKLLVAKRKNIVDPTELKNIMSDNKDILEKFNYFRIETQNDKFRYLLLKIALNKDEEITRRFTDNILTSSQYDNELISLSDGLLNSEEDLKLFKRTLIKLIMFDAYVLATYEFIKIKDEIKQQLSGLPFVNPSSICSPICDYIEKAVANNNYSLPTSPLLLNLLINNFLAFYICDEEKEMKISIVAQEKGKILSLLNPLYKLDDYE